MMTYLDYGVMFSASFMLVFLLGFQSKNVQHSRYIAAIVTSFGISVANFLFVKYAVAADLVTFFVCAVGGCLGISLSIWISDRMHRKPVESSVTTQPMASHYQTNSIAWAAPLREPQTQFGR